MSIGPIYGYTANYKFTLVEYDFPRWQSYEHDNWRNLDATLGTLFGTFGFGGIWKNGIVYNVNERIIDADENVIYLCLVDNTSAMTGTFGQDRAANPANWRSLSFTPANRGTWGSGTQYNVQDIVQSGSRIAICLLAHLSSNSFSADVTAGYWAVLIDVSGYNIGLALTVNNNLSDLSNATTARTNLGLGSAAQNNTGDFFKVSNNLSEGNATAIAASLGLKSGAFSDTGSYLVAVNNLSDLSNKGNARTNLGLGTLATLSAVTSGQISDAGSTGIALLKANTPADVVANINPFVGDSGGGGTQGLVPAPQKGDASAGKFLSANGTFTVPPYPTYTPPPPPPLGYASGLSIGTDATHVYVSFTSASLPSQFGGGAQVVGSNAGYSVTLTNFGPGGIQAGLTLSAGTFYPIYIIGNGTATNVFLGPNGSSPVMPTGYNYYYRIGYVKAKSGTALWLTQQMGNDIVFKEPTTASFSGTFGSGSGTSLTYSSQLCNNNVCPPGVRSVLGFLNSAVGTGIVAVISDRSNNSSDQGTDPPRFIMNSSSGGYNPTVVPFELPAGTNLYLYSNSSTFKVIVTGWRDLL